MKKGDKKKQVRAIKKRTESKLVHKQIRAVGLVVPSYHVRQARGYALDGCWIRQDWQKQGITPVVVARRQPNGNILFGNYLVDLYCLGVKNAFYRADVTSDEFRYHYLADSFADCPALEISPALAHEIIYGSIEYAAQFGFRPHRDFAESQHILDPPDAHPRTGKVEFGHKGKPLYVSGPYDNANAIMRQLLRTAGEGNFDYLVEVDGSLPVAQSHR